QELITLPQHEQSRYILSAMIRTTVLNWRSRLVALVLLVAGAGDVRAQEHPVKRVANIVTVALEEYAKGIDDRGRLISAQEYQEAVDFLQDARRTADRLPGAGAVTARALLDSIVSAVEVKRPPGALAGLHTRFA